MSTYCSLSTPALVTSATASPTDSMADAIRKLPLSFTRVGGVRLFGHHKGALADRVEQRDQRLQNLRVSRGDDEKLCGRGCFGPAEHRRRDILLTGFGIRGRQALGHRDTDGARRDMRRALSQRRHDALLTTRVAERHVLDGLVVGQHREHHRTAAGFGDAARRSRALLDKGFGFSRGAVVDGDVMTRIQQVCRHAAAHVPQADESDLHGIHPSSFRALFGPLLAMMSR
jgi:hypothetical protein